MSKTSANGIPGMPGLGFEDADALNDTRSAWSRSLGGAASSGMVALYENRLSHKGFCNAAAFPDYVPSEHHGLTLSAGSSVAE